MAAARSRSSPAASSSFPARRSRRSTRPARRCTSIWRRCGKSATSSASGFSASASRRLWTRAETPVMPKGRYAIMAPYMDRKVGRLGLDMMFRTCTVQVNLDFGSEADMVKKLRVSLALQPVATALFANSPFIEGRPNGFQSFRSADLARHRSRPHRHAALRLRAGLRLRALCRLCARRADVFRATATATTSTAPAKASAISWRASCRQLPGERPTLKDWADHLTTIFPEVRLKKYLEMRGADSGPVAAAVRAAGAVDRHAL